MMTSQQSRRSLLILLSHLVLAASFGPSVPKYHQIIKENTFNNPADENRVNLLREDARAAVFAASIGMNDTVIMEKYRIWCKKTTSDPSDLSDYTSFRRSFLRNLERTLNPTVAISSVPSPSNSTTTKKEEAAVVDELMVRSEYERWLVKYDKKADESRYPQFRKNFVQQFQRDLKEGTFYSLNEFGDCTEAEANVIKAERAAEEAKVLAEKKKAEELVIMAAKAVAEAERIKAEKAIAEAKAIAAQKEAEARARAAEKEAEARAKAEKEAAEEKARAAEKEAEARAKAESEAAEARAAKKAAFKARAIEAAAKAAAAKAAEEAKARELEEASKTEQSIPEIKFVDIPESIPETELAQRSWEAHMFTPTVRRDIYRVLRNSLDLTKGLTVDDFKANESVFSIALLARKDASGKVDGYAITDRRALERSDNGYAPCSDFEVIDAIKHIGYPTPHGIALTMAFENFLSRVTSNWGDRDAATLSVEFLVAFGTEMTKRLDVNHRIRSSNLSESDVAILKTQPYSACVDIKTLQAYGTYTTEEPTNELPIDEVPRRKRSDAQKKIVEAKVRTQFDADVLRARELDSTMFSSSLRRDIYKVLRNPNNILYGAPLPINEKTDVLGAVLLARRDPDGGWDSFAFADRHDFESLPSEEKNKFYKMEDNETIEAISYIGAINPVAIAITEAFEAYLKQIAVEWGDLEVAHFSVEFLVAFGQELTKRLDINNRLRSQKLSRDELLLLATDPFSACVDRVAMRYYQEENQMM